MPIPTFDGRSLLPPFLGADETTPDRSPYQTTMSELVSALGTSPIRENLLLGLLEYRELLNTSGYTDGMQFIDGSFVENIELRTSSPETIMDGDLNRLKNLNGGEAFLSILV